MSLAYIVHARNDLSVVPATGVNPGLQILDLVPNTSLKNRSLDGTGQTGYIPWAPTNDLVTLNGAGPIVTVGGAYGLRAYLVDHIENSGAVGDPALTVANLLAISNSLVARVEAGLSLTLADINTTINAAAGVSASDLDGTLGNSTGSVEGILKVLSGENYLLPDASQVETAANAFDATVRGYFVTAPNVELPESVRSIIGGVTLPVRGKSPYGPVLPTNSAVQTGTQDVNYRHNRPIVNTGDLHRSVINGALKDLAASTFTWENTKFSYGSGGTALTIAGTAIPTTFQARGVVVYDALGNVL